VQRQYVLQARRAKTNGRTSFLQAATPSAMAHRISPQQHVPARSILPTLKTNRESNKTTPCGAAAPKKSAWNVRRDARAIVSAGPRVCAATALTAGASAAESPRHGQTVCHLGLSERMSCCWSERLSQARHALR
jgi:hypothetical protein